MRPGPRRRAAGRGGAAAPAAVAGATENGTQRGPADRTLSGSPAVSGLLVGRRWSLVSRPPACGPAAADHEGGNMPLRMRVHDREPIGAALRRFKKLLERSGLTKELRKRKHYEKPCEVRRRAALRKASAIRKGKLQAGSRPA